MKKLFTKSILALLIIFSFSCEDINEDINSNYIKLNNFSCNIKDLIMKIDKLIPFAILVLTLLIAFVA